MAEKVLKTIIQLRRNTTEGWATKKDYVPYAGEPCLDTDTGIVKYGDGVTAYENLKASSVSASHYEGVKAAGESDTDVITRVLKAGTVEPQKDDIFIVKALITGDKYSYTAFVYNGSAWVAMDGNYNAKNVYFDEDITITTAWGNVKPDSTGQATVSANGKNVIEMLQGVLAKEDNPKSTNPTTTFTTGGSSGEVGSKYNLPTATFKVTSVGNYTYGSKDASGNKYGASDTGVTFAVNDVTITQGKNTKKNDSVLKLNSTLSLAATSDSAETLFGDTSVSYSFSATANYTESDRVPITNLGNKVDSLKIKSGTITQNCSATFTGWRKMFMGHLTNASTALTSDNIRALSLVNKQVSTSAQTFTVPVGTAKIVVAAPKGYVISKVEYFTMSWEEFSGFVSAPAVNVADARGGSNGLKEYNVFTYTPASPFEAATQFRVTLKQG